MRILCTGGAGYIGSMLVPELLAHGHEVTVVDNFMHGQTSLGMFVIHPALSIVVGDCRSYGLMAPLIDTAELVIPLAAIVGMPACKADPIAATSTNVEAVKMIRERKPSRKIIIPITNSGYGIGGQVECTEDSPLQPISHYGTTKVRAETAALAQRGEAISLRLATVFGMSGRMRLDLLVNEFVNRALTDRAIVLFEGHFKRNYIHVRDVAGAFLHAIANFDEMKGRPYNVGLSDANLSKAELCERIKRYIPEFAVMHAAIGEDPDKRDYIVSNARIEATGWRPKYSLDEGIAELVKGLPMIRNREHRNA